MRLAPASVTKIMTILLVAEEIGKGTLKLTDIVQISDNASHMGGSQVYLKAGEQMSVEDLLKSVIIASANDAATALAEQVAGSVEGFVERMNAVSYTHLDVYKRQVDYGLLDKDGDLLGMIYHYRDVRTNGIEAEIEKKLGMKNIFLMSGIQNIWFNTSYQLCSMKDVYKRQTCVYFRLPHISAFVDLCVYKGYIPVVCLRLLIHTIEYALCSGKSHDNRVDLL